MKWYKNNKANSKQIWLQIMSKVKITNKIVKLTMIVNKVQADTR